MLLLRKGVQGELDEKKSCVQTTYTRRNEEEQEECALCYPGSELRKEGAG